MRFCTAAASWVLLALLPFTASALGLGNISLDSALNEPFSAEIPLQSVGSTDLNLLTVSLATRDTFERYDLDKPLFLSSFEFKLDKNADGQPIIRVTSTSPVAEPFVTFLVDVKWASGRLLR
jgi:pilus assembly protein FimV